MRRLFNQRVVADDRMTPEGARDQNWLSNWVRAQRLR